MSADPVLDFDRWLGGQDAETRAGIEAGLRFVPEPDRPALKQRFGAALWLGERTGIDPAEIDARWEIARDGFAEQQGGDWLGTKGDDAKFFARVRQQAERDRDELTLIGGSDEDPASREASLLNRAYSAAVLGESPAAAFMRWQGEVEGAPGFSPEKRDTYLRMAQEAHEEASRRLAPVRWLARDIFTTVADGRDLEEASESMIERVSALRDEERRALFSAVRVMADAAPEGKGDTFWGNLAKQSGRGIASIFRGLADTASFLREVQKLDDAGPFFPWQGTEKFEEQAKASAQKWREHNLESDIRRVRESSYSPAKEVLGDYIPDWVERGIYGAPQTVATTLMALVPIAGVPATFATIAQQNYEQERFRLRDAGLGDEAASAAAAVMAPIAAAPEAALERLGASAVLGRLPALKATLLKLGDKAGGGLAGYGVRVAGGATVELLTERTQDLMLPIVEAAAAALSEDLPGVEWRNGKDGVLDGWWTQTGETFVALLPLALIGAAGGGRGRSLAAASDLQLQAFGAKPEHIAALREAEKSGEFSLEDAAETLIANRDGNSDAAKAATEELQKIERDRAGIAARQLRIEMGELGVRSLTRDAEGWLLTTEEGETIRVGSAEAATSILRDLKQATTQQEAEGLVTLIEQWHAAAPEGTRRETTLTGEEARSDGEAITYTRDGEVTREVTSPAALDGLREEARMDAQLSGETEIDVAVNGSNEVFREKVASGAEQLVQRLEINRSDSAALTFLHESVEADWRAGIASGAFTREETQRAIAALAVHFDPATARDAEERAFRERVQKVARGEASETELRETLSELAVADFLGKRKDGSRVPAGSVTAAIDAALRDNADSKTARELGKLRAFLRAVRQYFRALFGTAAALRKARKAGATEEFDALLDTITGRDAQGEFDRERSEEAAAIADESGLEYREPGEEEVASGVAFSLKASMPERDARPLHPIPIPDDVLPGDRRGDWQRAVRDFIASHLQGRRIVNRDTGWGIDFTAESKAEAPSKLRSEPAARAAMQAETIVEEAILLGDTPPKPGRASDTERMYYFAVPVTIDGRIAVAWFNVRKPLQSPHPVEAGSFYEFGLFKKDAVQATQGLDTERDAQPDTPQPAPQLTVGQFLSQIKGVLPAAIKVENAPSFRLSAGSRLEAMQNRLDAAMARDPEARRRIARNAAKKLQALQFDLETTRWTGRGDEIRPVVERRTAAEMDREQAFRQAARAEELREAGMRGLSDDALTTLASGAEKLRDRPLIETLLSHAGRLMSKTEAARRGRQSEYDGAPAWAPPWLYGGTIMPDEAAQILHDAGLLRDAYPDTFWQALEREIQSVRATNAAFKKASKAAAEIEKQARNRAREEAAEWRREQDAMQARDWNPRAAITRDLRALDAMVSVLPLELRGKVGGFVKLSTLGSEQARLKELHRRIEKISALVEKWLKKESTAALEALLEKAAPKREAGEQSRGKIGAEAHRYFDRVAEARELTAEQVEGRKAEIAALMADPALTPEQAAELFEREQILDTFGNWKEKTAADMDAAVRAAEKVFADGRNQWLEREGARVAEVQEIAAAVVDRLGGASIAGTQAAKKKAKTLKSHFFGGGLDLKSFAEVLDTLLGEKHPVAKRWRDAVRNGYAQRNDEIRAMRQRWKGAMESALGLKGLRARRRLWEMGQEQTITVDTEGEASATTQRVPIETIERWESGELDPAGLGVSPEDAARLIAQKNALPDGSRKKFLPLTTEARTVAGPVQMTEAEGIFLTMLAGQEQYAEALDRAGWSAEALVSVESQLSDGAKKLRQFLRNEYREGYAPLASVFERMFGVELPQIANYAPASFYHTGADRSMTPEGDPLMEGGMRAGFLRNRKKHAAIPKLENAFATFFGHAEQAAHWKALAEFTREFSAVLGNPDVKRAIESAHGADMLKALNQWRETIEGNGLQVKSGKIDELIRRFISGPQTYIALAWNLGTMAKQSLALLGSAHRIPASAYARGFVRLLSGQLDARAMFNSPVIQRRLEMGSAPEVRAAINAAWNAKPTRRMEFVERGMEVLGFVDAFFTTGSAAIAYDYHHRTAIESGLAGEAAHEAAMREVEEIVERTAQPVDAPSRSLVEQRMNAFGRLLFMFVSEARQKSSMWLTAWANTLAGKPAAAHWRVLAISHLVVGPMLQGITAAWWDARDDDDDELFDSEHWKLRDFLIAGATGPLGGVPLLNDLFSGFRGDGPLSRYTRAAAAATALATKEPREGEPEKAEWYMDRILRLMQGLDSFTGVAAKLAGQGFDVVDNLFDDDAEAARKEAAARRREAKAAREAAQKE